MQESYDARISPKFPAFSRNFMLVAGARWSTCLYAGFGRTVAAATDAAADAGATGAAVADATGAAPDAGCCGCRRH